MANEIVKGCYKDGEPKFYHEFAARACLYTACLVTDGGIHDGQIQVTVDNINCDDIYYGCYDSSGEFEVLMPEECNGGHCAACRDAVTEDCTGRHGDMTITCTNFQNKACYNDPGGGVICQEFYDECYERSTALVQEINGTHTLTWMGHTAPWNDGCFFLTKKTTDPDTFYVETCVCGDGCHEPAGGGCVADCGPCPECNSAIGCGWCKQGYSEIWFWLAIGTSTIHFAIYGDIYGPTGPGAKRLWSETRNRDADGPCVCASGTVAATDESRIATGEWFIDPLGNFATWVLFTPYVELDAVLHVVLPVGKCYVCILAHTSTALDEPGIGVNWETYWVLV
ncbi:MAG: hypothetical protein FVQ80_11505 [Planctomycetes bacterium]|nr:hypothetical protein [Planctomycetota bacterium]